MAPTRKDPSTSRGRKKDHEGILDSSDDEGYRKKRDRNNMAVKRSRVKSRMKTQETVERVEQLKRENDQLVEKINLMSKELSFLKELFIAQASSTGIPSNVDLDTLFADNEPITDTRPDFFDHIKSEK
ncbi:Basic region leucine zipper [Nesidiocoris tenuis]|uniref:Basic region leucine zipper n=1 Tax=Nesidiocoris tenuis TaxID=355587 RepID=A0ABN7BDA8_9HEMI|nr:Basic region leucine zipper [Nesidiocoris tenuis]